MTLMKVPCLWARTSAGAWGCWGRCDGFADTLTINLPVSRQGRPPGCTSGSGPPGGAGPPRAGRAGGRGGPGAGGLINTINSNKGSTPQLTRDTSRHLTSSSHPSHALHFRLVATPE